jgi:glycosyltransferase involved in cell wall biosynthesis
VMSRPGGRGDLGKGAGVLFIGQARYSHPLDHTTDKKFANLSQLFACYVVAFSRGWRPLHFRQQAVFYLFPLLPTSLLRYGVLALGAFLIGVYLCLKGAVQVVVAQSPYEGLTGALIRRASRLLGRRVVLVTEAHGDWEESLLLYKKVPFPRLYRFVLARLAARALRQSDLIRAVSPFTRDKVGQVVPGKAVFTFPGYTDIELFLAQPDAEPAANAPGMVLFVGALVYLKGVHNLIAALAALGADYPQARLVIVGQGGYRGELEKLVERLGLSGKVTFTGELSQPLLQEYMQECSMLVLPSLSEGLPRVLLEAMACGKPVIGAAVGGIPGLIEDGVNGFLVPPDDVQSLAECIKKLLADERLARSLGERGRDFVARTFSTERYVAGYAEIVEYASRLASGR